MDNHKIAREFSEWLTEKAEIRQVTSPIHQNLIHLTKTHSKEELAIVGSSTLSTDGLGIIPSASHHMNTCFHHKDEIQSLMQWFENMWNTAKKNGVLKKELQTALQRIYTEKSPRLIYFLTLYNLFKNFISELDEESIIKTKTGIKGTQVWQMLYKFQKDGALGAIDKLERYSGCIIADSVGLGKTFEALAAIKNEKNQSIFLLNAQ